MTAYRIGFGLLVLPFVLWGQTAAAKARFIGLDELVAISDVIAIIEVNKSEKLGEPFEDHIPQKGYYQYAQKNTFQFLEFIKVHEDATPDKEQMHTLWANKNFKCARAIYEKGKYLVFLENITSKEWITLNHNDGALRIDDANRVNWDSKLIEKDESKKEALDKFKDKVRTKIVDFWESEADLAKKYSIWISSPKIKSPVHDSVGN
jgi:hypothetical protein